MSIEKLAARELQTRRDLRKAEDAAKEAHKELEAAEQKKRDTEQKAQYALECKEAVKSTKLPKWTVLFIQAEAYARGHSAGESEVDMLTTGMIHEAERYFERFDA